MHHGKDDHGRQQLQERVAQNIPVELILIGGVRYRRRYYAVSPSVVGFVHSNAKEYCSGEEYGRTNDARGT